jgi:hypothetical protein
MAAAVALTPWVVGADRNVTDTSSLGALEGATLDHVGVHTESAAEKRRYLRQVARCLDDGYRARHAVLCPDPAERESAARVADVGVQSFDGTRVSAFDQRAIDGEWGGLFSVPSTAIHAIVLPTNKVLWFSQPKNDPLTNQPVDGAGGNAHLFDPATGLTTSVPPPLVDYGDGGPPAPANVWCGGQTQLADGRVLVAGGNLAYPDYPNPVGAGSGFTGAKWVVTFDPWSETWTRHPDMPHGRWYPTLTELPDGRVLILGGWDETGGIDDPDNPAGRARMVNNMDVEVFDPETDTVEVVDELPPLGEGDPKPYPDHTGLGLYPHVFVLPAGTELGEGGDKVLVAGPLKWDSTVLDTSDWTWRDFGPPLASDRSWGTAWLEPSGPGGSSRVVLLGGTNAANSAPGDPSTKDPPLATAEFLDLDEPGTGWQPAPGLELQAGRSHFNTVLLPDGSLLSSGGGYGQKNGSLYADPIYESELLEAGSTAWSTVGSEGDARTYHSTAVLLPDGRVLSAGDDRDAHIPADARTAQIWSPPYLFRGARPAFTFSPDEVRYDAGFRVAVAGLPTGIDRAVLVRPGAVTHANDMAQRSIELTMTAQDDGLALESPADPSLAPPGYYMLYLVDADGVPSLPAWVRLDPAAPDAPALPIVPAQAVTEPTPAPPPSFSPTTSPVTPVLRLSVATAPVVLRGGRARVTLRLLSTRGATVRLTLARTGGAVIASRRFALKAGRRSTRVIVVPRTSLRTSTRLTLRIVITDTHGRTVVRRAVVRVPRARGVVRP